MGKSDIVFAAIFALLSAFLFALTLRFPKLTIALSPVVFPRFVTTCLFILSAILMVQGIRKCRAPRGGVRREKRSGGRSDRSFAIRFILLVADALLYVWLMEPAGYLIATPPFIAGAMLIFGDRKWYRIILISISSTAILYSVFRTIFRVPLPRSPIW